MNSNTGLLAELADAMDSKSIAANSQGVEQAALTPTPPETLSAPLSLILQNHAEFKALPVDAQARILAIIERGRVTE